MSQSSEYQTSTHRATSKLSNQIEKARRVLAFVDARAVAYQASTYSDEEWWEMAVQAGENPPSDEVVTLCRELLVERFRTRAAEAELRHEERDAFLR